MTAIAQGPKDIMSRPPRNAPFIGERWEYCIDYIGNLQDDDALNDLGAKGWELIALRDYNSDYVLAYFKRRVIPDMPQFVVSAGEGDGRDMPAMVLVITSVGIWVLIILFTLWFMGVLN